MTRLQETLTTGSLLALHSKTSRQTGYVLCAEWARKTSRKWLNNSQTGFPVSALIYRKKYN